MVLSDSPFSLKSKINSSKFFKIITNLFMFFFNFMLSHSTWNITFNSHLHKNKEFTIYATFFLLRDKHLRANLFSFCNFFRKLNKCLLDTKRSMTSDGLKKYESLVLLYLILQFFNMWTILYFSFVFYIFYRIMKLVSYLSVLLELLFELLFSQKYNSNDVLRECRFFNIMFSYLYCTCKN